MPLGLKSQVNGKRENFGKTSMSISLLSKHEGKAFNREFDRKVNNGPDNKRPRLDQSDIHAKNTQIDDDSTIFQKKTDLIRCSSADKVWLIKPKRGADGKRNDRKNFRSGIKTRYDTLPTKMGISSFDSTSAGNNLLGRYPCVSSETYEFTLYPGTHGLKSDISDITRHIDEIGISELLDGSYRYSNVNAEKGKKPPVVSESMLTSLKKAISVLPYDGLTYSNSNGKEAICLSKFSSSPVQDCSHPNKDDESTNTKYPNIGDADLYQPKKILEHLVIPSGSDLSTLLDDLSLTLSTSKLTKPSKNSHAASLPPFSWSYSHSSACKPTVDSSKQVLTKHACDQGRWIRIDCNSLLTGDNQHCFLDLEMLTVDNNGDPLQRSAVLQDNHLDSSPKFPCGQLSNMVFQTSNYVERNAPDDIRLEKGPCLSVLTHKRLNFVENHAQCSSSLECDNKDSCLVRTSGTEASMKFQGKDPDLPDHIRSASMLCSTKVLKDLHTLNEPGCCVSSGSLNCKDIGECSWSLPNLSASDMSQHDYSPRELHAAGILLEMTRHWSALKVQTEDCGKIRWPKSSQKAMKNHKSISPMGRSELFRTRNHDPVRTADLPYWEHKPIEKKNDMRMSGRATIKNSNQLEGGVSPHKLEKDLQVGGSSSLPNATVRSTSLIPTMERVGNGYETHQKLRKTTGPSFMVGTYIKDWSRGRNKQE